MPQKRPAGVNPQMSGYVVRKRKKKLTRKSVLNMLAVMEASQKSSDTSLSSITDEKAAAAATAEKEEPRPQDFLQSGRTGRRNALANILSEHAVVTSSDLPSKLEALTTKDRSDDAPSNEDAASTSSKKS